MVLRKIWVLFGLVLAAGVNAQIDNDEDVTEGNSEHSLRAGVAGVVTQSIYLDGDSQTRFFPAIDYQYKQFYFQAGNLGLHLLKNKSWEIDVGIGANLAGDVDRGDSDVLDDMPDLSIPVNGFVSAQYKTSIGLFKAAYQKEINNKHDGDSASLSYTIAFPVGNLLLYPTLSANYYSEESINYFYGVDTPFVRPDRPFYRADSEVIYQLSILTLKPITEKFTFVANLSYDSYGNEISDSPIVVEDDSLSFFAGVLYTFF